jgi:ketosteroid isomerase-like protein
MSQQDVEVVQRLFQDGRMNRDPRLEDSWQDALDVLDPDFEYSEDPVWPGAGTYRGIPAFRRVMSGYFDAFAAQRVEAEEFLDAGDRVLVFMSWWARGHSGVEAVWPQAWIFTVRGGRLARLQVVFDREQALKAVGLTG